MPEQPEPPMTSKESDVSEGVEPWIVWSNEHRSFWAPNRCGYTGRIERAGRYTKAEAEAICKNANYRANSTINVGTPPEICMPAPEATLSPPLSSPHNSGAVSREECEAAAWVVFDSCDEVYLAAEKWVEDLWEAQHFSRASAEEAAEHHGGGYPNIHAEPYVWHDRPRSRPAAPLPSPGVERRAEELFNLIYAHTVIKYDPKAGIRACVAALSALPLDGGGCDPDDERTRVEERAAVVRYLRTWLGSCQCIAQANAFADAFERGDHVSAASKEAGR